MFKDDVAVFLADHVELSQEEVHDELERPPRRELGDAAFPCYKLAEKRGEEPGDVATELATIEPPSSMEKTEAHDAYLNCYRSQQSFQDALEALDVTPRDAVGKTVTIDYSSPNIAKPISVGHLRSTVIGHALYNVYDFLGWNAVGINHLGDWGTQFGNLIAAYKRWPVDLSEDPIDELVDIYVQFNEEAVDDEELQAAGREWFRKLERGDDEAVSLWKRFRALSLDEFERIYDALNVSFDHVHGESFYRDKMDRVKEELDEAGLLEESEDALIVDLSEYDMPPVIVEKSDGASTYATRELAGALYRRDEFDFDKNVYEVGSEQSLHFKQIFKVLELLGYDWSNDCKHVQHGLYKFDDAKMSTREGNVVRAEDMFDEAIRRVRDRMRASEYDIDDVEAVAEQVGVGALVFNEVKRDRVKDVEFDWEALLNLDGDTGPYLQYTHARVASVCAKSDEDAELCVHLDADLERTLISHLERFDSVLEDVIRRDKPHFLAQWLLQLAHRVNAYYQQHRVIQDDAALEQSRLYLLRKVEDFLETGLRLLGMDAPKSM